MPKIANLALLEQPEQYALGIRCKTDVARLPQEIGKAYEKIAGYLAELGELMSDAPFVCYYNMAMDNLDVLIGFSTAKPLPAAGEILSEIIPAGKVLTSLFLGPYKDSAPVYGEMMDWIAASKFEALGTAFEYYLNDPDRPESDFLIKIVMPLK